MNDAGFKMFTSLCDIFRWLELTNSVAVISVIRISLPHNKS